VEQRKSEIEIEYLGKVHEVKQKLYDIDTRRMLLEEELTLKRLGYKGNEIKTRIAELEGQRKEIRDQADEANDAAIQAARETAANRQTQLIRDHTKQVFDSLKEQAGGVFDSLLNKSQSVWAAIANTLKTAVFIDDSHLSTDFVAIGNAVRVLDMKYNEEDTYTVVGLTETDPARLYISGESPIGKALMGSRVGDTVEAQTPNGALRLKVLEISKR
jgi:hypothetical protein